MLGAIPGLGVSVAEPSSYSVEEPDAGGAEVRYSRRRAGSRPRQNDNVPVGSRGQALEDLRLLDVPPRDCRGYRGGCRDDRDRPTSKRALKVFPAAVVLRESFRTLQVLGTDLAPKGGGGGFVASSGHRQETGNWWTLLNLPQHAMQLPAEESLFSVVLLSPFITMVWYRLG